MSNGFGAFRSVPSGYVSYKVFQESRKGGGGGKGPSSNSGCMTAIFFALAAVILVCAFVI